MTAPIALRAMFGQDEANHGTMRYRVSANRLVTVPPAAAIHLVKNGGFALANPTAARLSKLLWDAPLSGSLVALRHPTGTGCSYGGVEYHADENGMIFVLTDAVVELIAHGFAPIQQEEAERHKQSERKRRTSTTGSLKLGPSREFIDVEN